MKPSVGRIVHYRSYGTPGGEYLPECRAAIVTEVDTPPENAPWMEPVGLCVLNPTGQFFNRGVKHDEEKSGGTWHWPERADG